METTMLESAKVRNSPLEIVRRVYDNLPFNRLLGLTVEFLDSDRAGFCFAMQDELIGNTTHGILHGGVISTVLDTTGRLTASAAAVERMTDLSNEAVAELIARIGTIDLRVDYLRNHSFIK